MKIVSIINERTGTILGDQVVIADSFLLRLKGLIGRKQLLAGEGLWLTPCNQVHMIGMKFPLSIWFIDNSGNILDIIENLKPRQISPKLTAAKSIIEFPSDWAKNTATSIGDRIICSNQN